MNRSVPSSLFLGALCALLAGCNWFSFGSKPSGQSSSSSAASSVSSEAAAPTSVFLQGTVKVNDGPLLTVELLTPVGTTYTLLSSSIPLSTYEGKEVEVSGTLSENSDTAEQLLQVDEITIVVSSSVASGSGSVVQSSSSSSVAASSLAMSSATSSVVTPKPASSSAAPVKTSSSSQAMSSASASVGYSADDVKKMARPRADDAWTQKYCSSYIGVCFPVRNDYWFTSFSNTTSTLWHVEIGAHQLENPGEGPLAVDLFDSRLPEGVSDGQTVEENGMVKSYRVWTGNKHFEVSGPTDLRASVEFLASHIGPYETATPTP